MDLVWSSHLRQAMDFSIFHVLTLNSTKFYFTVIVFQNTLPLYLQGGEQRWRGMIYLTARWVAEARGCWHCYIKRNKATWRQSAMPTVPPTLPTSHSPWQPRHRSENTNERSLMHSNARLEANCSYLNSYMLLCTLKCKLIQQHLWFWSFFTAKSALNTISVCVVAAPI